MLPELFNEQNVFVEITNPEHGGENWELGICLWSPVLDIGHNHAWLLMGEIHQGDLIIHLVKMNNNYHWYGISIADSDLIQTNNEPPLGGNWANMAPYQRVNLINFIMVEPPILISDFFNQYDLQLRQILTQFDYGQFYNEYRNKGPLRVAQRYIAKCPRMLYTLFNEFSDIINFNPIFGANEIIPTPHEPLNPDFNPPGRIDTIVSRIIRDTQLSRTIKAENNWSCQICGSSIRLPENNLYAEGHHLRPLGGIHQGLDIRPNIIILCPTHHTEFDYRSIAINPHNSIIEHIDPNNPFHNRQIAYQRNDLGTEYLEYHYNTLFRGL